jgi:peptide/nickel transport system substrate-binding protein
MIARFRNLLALGLLITAGVALAPLLAGCGASSASQSGVSAGPVSTTFTYDTYYQVMMSWDPSTGYSNEIIGMSNMYETLTRYNAVTKTVDPLLATSWTSSPNGLTWTFKLRPNVYFHTGRLMTAQAVKAAIERTIKLNQGAAYIWGAVGSIDTPSQDTIVFHLKYAAPFDLIVSADFAAYIFDTKASGSESLTKWFAAGHDAGTGPYTVQAYNPGQETELALAAFPKYWGGWSGTHYKRAVFRVVPQDTTAAQLLSSGQVSFVEQMSASLWASLKTNPQLQLISMPTWENYLAQMNCKSGPLASLAVRQAISYAINYKGIIAALKGAGTLSSGIVPPGLWGHSDDLPNYQYDPTKAAQLLQSAGYGPGGKPMKLLMTITQGDSNQQLVATIMKSELTQVNVNLRIQTLAWAAQWAKAQSSNVGQRQDIFVMNWYPDYADPYSWFINIVHTEASPYFNLSYSSNPRLDTMMARAERDAATNRAEAVTLYQQMQVTLLQQASVLFLYNLNGLFAALKSVGNLQMNPAYPNVVFVYDLKPLPS